MAKTIESDQLFYKYNEDDTECNDCSNNAVVEAVCCPAKYCEDCAIDYVTVTKRGNLKYKCDNCETTVMVRLKPKN